MRKRLVILFIILAVVLGAIFFSYFILSKDNRGNSASSDGISVYRSANMEIASLSFNFVLAKNPEFVNISYDVRNIEQNATGLVTIDMPYDGILSLPDNWSANKSTTSDSTLIYRLFRCSNTNPCSKDFNGQVVFTFSKDIDEKDGYHHSMQLDIKQSPFDEGVTNIIQTIETSINYSLLSDFPFSIAIFLDSNSDRISPLPQPDEQHSSSIFGINTKVFSWSFKKGVDDLITIDYENPDERTEWTIFEILAYPTGAAIIIAVAIELIKSVGWLDSDSNSRQKKSEHSKFLNEQVYRRLLDVYTRPQHGRKLGFKVPLNYQQYQIERIKHLIPQQDPPLIPVTSLQYLEYAMKHLKHRKYKKILTHWNKAEKLLDEYNGIIESVENLLIIRIKTEMQVVFPDLIEFQGDGRDSSYFSDAIRDRLLDFHEHESNIDQIDLVKGIIHGDNVTRIISDGMTLMQSPNPQTLDIDKCRQVLVACYNDQNIQRQFERLKKIRKEMGTEIGQFSAELEDLVTKINGGHIIEGKCDLEN